MTDDRQLGNELLWQIKDTIATMKDAGQVPVMVLMTPILHRAMQKALKIEFDQISRVPICPGDVADASGWKVL